MRGFFFGKYLKLKFDPFSTFWNFKIRRDREILNHKNRNALTCEVTSPLLQPVSEKVKIAQFNISEVVLLRSM